ncbi:MAG: hypothetical protein H7276_17200, partial [Caulobacter sp.]|nr:hypothetical protein [Vitreoscilla sp.]
MNARDGKLLAGAGTKGARAGQGAGLGVPAPLFSTSTRTPTRSTIPISAARQRKLHVGHFA